MGFVKAFELAEISELTLPISPGWGLLWLATALTLASAGVLWLLQMEAWWFAAITGVILSQALIFVYWQDARFGTIPNVGAFRSGAEASGIFEIAGNLTAGFIRGEYSVQNRDGQISIELIPSGGWIPNEPKLTLRFLYRVLPMFKEWPATYRWTAELEQNHESRFTMRSN